MIKELERVVLKSAVPAEGLEAGDVGTVVHIHKGRAAYEVEFMTLDGHTVAVVTVESSQLRPVSSRDISHVRELTTVRSASMSRSANSPSIIACSAQFTSSASVISW